MPAGVPPPAPTPPATPLAERPAPVATSSAVELVRAIRRKERTRTLHRIAGTIASVAAILHLASIPVALSAIKFGMEAVVGRSISWPEFFGALNAANHGWLFAGMVFVQIVFTINAGIMSYGLLTNRPRVALFMIPAGIFAVAYSFLVFGGYVGSLAGVLTALASFLGFPWVRAVPFPS